MKMEEKKEELRLFPLDVHKGMGTEKVFILAHDSDEAVSKLVSDSENLFIPIECVEEPTPVIIGFILPP